VKGLYLQKGGKPMPQDFHDLQLTEHGRLYG
jgi:hypothetical protein